jgi:hypothetical protein
VRYIYIYNTPILKRRWQWIGHVLRMDNNRNARTALDWAPDGKRKRGRPKETWGRTVEKDRKQLGFNTWAEATRQAQDRSKWRGLVHDPILHEETGNSGRTPILYLSCNKICNKMLFNIIIIIKR